MSITLTDLFCGAGGSSTGALQLPGVEVVMAANHSRHAIDTHQTNHPTTRHDCADISQVVPQRYPRYEPEAEDRRGTAFERAVADHAIPYLRPVLTELGRPELADCFFQANPERTRGQFVWLDLAAGDGATFCAAQIEAVA